MINDIDRDVDNPKNYKLYVFYYNPKDKRVIVPKQHRSRGWTLNFGHFYSYIILAAIILFIIYFIFV